MFGRAVPTWLCWSAAAVLLCGLVVLGQAVIGPWLRAVPEKIGRLGVWAPVGFALVYVLAVVALAPASVLTLAAGALFGVPRGLVIVSAASTLGAAAAFLIARHLARDRVRRWLLESPRLAAIDRAVRDGGWKLVALLRLSPAVPFNIQNYLYGITDLPFWPCMITSWVAMLPGTLLYVVLGHAGRAGLEAVGGARGRTPAEWLMLAVGVASTLVLTVYLTRLVRARLGPLPVEESEHRRGPDAPGANA